MKNLVKSVMVAATVSMFSISASAMGGMNVFSGIVQDTIVKDTVKKNVPQAAVFFAQSEITYSKIEVAEVPQPIKSAVASKYAAYTVEKAYKGSDNNYKLVLKNDNAKLVVYYNENGEFVKEETVEAEQTVILI